MTEFYDGRQSPLKEYDLTANYDHGEPVDVKPCLEDLTLNGRFSISELIGRIDESESSSRKFLSHVDNEYTALLWVFSTILESRSAADVLFSLTIEDWEISLRDDMEGYSYDFDEKCIFIGTDGQSASNLKTNLYLRNSALLDAIQCLRDIWHDTYTISYTKNLRLEELLKWERMRRADTTVFTVSCARDLSHSEDHQHLWNHILSHGEGDVALSFEAFEHTHLGNPDLEEKLLAAAFIEWFSDANRVTESDKFALDEMDAILKSDTNMGFRTERITADLISEAFTLSEYGRYLGNLCKELAINPDYGRIHDDICLMHFMQIADEMETVSVEAIPFRDKELARKIFPDSF
ncbi:MAG: hypothetical protein CL565_05795 [Alphaproteobacteria bacterium]|nr:hypothetical protein [Alphaproteobacteria bacterium]